MFKSLFNRNQPTSRERENLRIYEVQLLRTANESAAKRELRLQREVRLLNRAIARRNRTIKHLREEALGFRIANRLLVSRLEGREVITVGGDEPVEIMVRVPDPEIVGQFVDKPAEPHGEQGREHADG